MLRSVSKIFLETKKWKQHNFRN